MRSLLLAMNRWITDGTPPPPSRYPRIDDGTLVELDAFNFPALPGINLPTKPHKAYRVDYGPDFESRGIISRQPPLTGQAFPVLVPQVDDDGNEIGGLSMPGVAVPLATYTGWNLYQSEYGPVDELAHMSGSYIPFATTPEQRQASGDPRPAILERYSDRAQYLGLVAESAIKLINEGYLLGEDLPQILARAATHWDYRLASESADPESDTDEPVCTIARMGKDCGF
jgi:hypothetical protein